MDRYRQGNRSNEAFMDDGKGAGVAASNRREDQLVLKWQDYHNKVLGEKILFISAEPVGGEKRYEYIENYTKDDGDTLVTFMSSTKKYVVLMEVKSVRWRKQFARLKVDDVKRYIKDNRPVMFVQYCNMPNPKMRWYFPEDLKRIEEFALKSNVLISQDEKPEYTMTSDMRYPGGKTRKSIQKKILACAPPEFNEYREPFVGGGGIFFAIEEGREFEPVFKWINDINQDLISVYRALKYTPDDFIAKCKSIEPMKKGEPEVYPTKNSSGKKYNARLKSKFDEFAKGEGCDQALRYFFINRTVWGGRVIYDPKMKSRLYFSNPTGWGIVKTKRLEQAARYLKNTKITSFSYDAMLLLNAHKGRKVFVYCDPPYVKNTELEASSQLYSFGFTQKDHIAFAEVVKESPHSVCISYDDDEDGFVRSLFPKSEGFWIKDTTWTYCGTSSAKSQKTKSTKKLGRELIITNYEC